MTPKQTIYNMLCTYPTIFPNYDSAVFHLLMSSNNTEYKWHNGEIINEEENTPITNFDEAVNVLFDKVVNPEEIMTSPLKYLLNNLKNSVKSLHKIDERMVSNMDSYLRKINKLEYGRISCSSLLFNIPSDITEEWRSFCIDFVNTLNFHLKDIYDNNSKIEEIEKKLYNFNIINT